MKLNQNIVITVSAETDTIIPISIESSFTLKIKNFAPVFDNSFNVSKLRIKDILAFDLLYSNYWTSNLTYISISDDELDSTYLTITLNGTNISQGIVILDKNNWVFKF